MGQTVSQNKDDQKDQKIIYEALGRMRERGITDTKQFTLQLVYIENKTEYKCNEVDENNNNRNKKEKDERISQLIDENNKEMCKYGHAELHEDEKADLCVSCGSKKELKLCWDCVRYEEFNKVNYNSNASDFTYCSDCRIRNGKNISRRIKLNDFKATIIRKELLANPCLEMDVLCNMQRRAAVDWLIKDINQLERTKRRQWCLLVMDLDHLKCWNSCLGHVKTDGLIQKIGDIMSKNMNDINSGKWKVDNKWSLTQGFVYRTGGDEFVIAIKCGGTACWCPLGPFYNGMKKEINELGEEKNLKDLFDNENEWKEAKEELKNAKDREGNTIDMSRVGISTGMYIPSRTNVKDTEWLSVADKIALEHSKIINKPTKNGVAIYWEGIGLIDDKKVGKCLKEGVLKGMGY